MFFHDEFGFGCTTRGMEPWQLGPLNRTLQFPTAVFVSGGHNEVMREHRMRTK